MLGVHVFHHYQVGHLGRYERRQASRCGHFRPFTEQDLILHKNRLRVARNDQQEGVRLPTAVLSVFSVFLKSRKALCTRFWCMYHPRCGRLSPSDCTWSNQPEGGFARKASAAPPVDVQIQAGTSVQFSCLRPRAGIDSVHLPAAGDGANGRTRDEPSIGSSLEVIHSVSHGAHSQVPCILVSIYLVDAIIPGQARTVRSAQSPEVALGDGISTILAP